MNAFPQVKIGISESGDPVMWDAPRHIAIQGMTRSGKSVGMYSLLARMHATGRVRLVGVDPTAVLLRPFQELGEEQIHCGGAELEKAVDVLTWAVGEMDRRIDRLWAHRIDQIPRYSRKLPIIMCVIEEAPGFMTALADDDADQGRKTGAKLAPMAAARIRRIVAEGAKVGVLACVIAQRMSTQVIPGDARANLGYRITLRMDDPDGVRMLHTGLSDENVQHVATARPGRGVVDSPGFHQKRLVLDHLEYQDYLAALGYGA